MSAAIFGLTLGKRTPASDSELVLVQTSAGELPPLQDRAYAGAVLDVAFLDPNGEAIRKFAEKRGWLNAPLPFAVVEGWPSGTVVEPIADWIAAIHSIRHVVMQWVELGEMIQEFERRGDAEILPMRHLPQVVDATVMELHGLLKRITTCRADIQQHVEAALLPLVEAEPMGMTLKDGRWQPIPKTLHQALWVSLGDMSGSSAVSLRKCKQCGKWMRIGKGGFSKNREFCSDACKLRYHRLAKAAASP
jgi:hypothetical protein